MGKKKKDFDSVINGDWGKEEGGKHGTRCQVTFAGLKVDPALSNR